MRCEIHRMIRALVLGGVALVTASAGFGMLPAEAAVHVGIGLGVPPVVAAPPVVVAPPPVAYAAPPVVAVPPLVYGWGGYGHDWGGWHRGGWHGGGWHGGGWHGGGHGRR
jgi:hypothetical protein